MYLVFAKFLRYFWSINAILDEITFAMQRFVTSVSYSVLVSVCVMKIATLPLQDSGSKCQVYRNFVGLHVCIN